MKSEKQNSIRTIQKKLAKKYSVGGKILETFIREKSFHAEIENHHDPNEGYKISYVYEAPLPLAIDGKVFLMSFGVPTGSILAPAQEIREHEPHLLIVPTGLSTESTAGMLLEKTEELKNKVYLLSSTSIARFENDGAFFPEKKLQLSMKEIVRKIANIKTELV